jgi:hypothetical protein
MSWWAYRLVYTTSTAKMIWNFRRRSFYFLKYWNGIKANVEDGNTKYRGEFIRILDRMAISHDTTNAPVACGVRVVMCHVESSCLDDDEARLVQCITDIHIDRAASIIKAKSAA